MIGDLSKDRQKFFTIIKNCQTVSKFVYNSQNLSKIHKIRQMYSKSRQKNHLRIVKQEFEQQLLIEILEKVE